MTEIKRRRPRGQLPVQKKSPVDGECSVSDNGEVTGEVYGTPIPQGSKIVSRFGGMRDSNPKLPLWRERMTKVIAEAVAADWEPPDVPLFLCAEFLFPPLKSDPDRVAPTTKSSGDTDKLLRALADSLTKAGAIIDDSRIVGIGAFKRYAKKGEEPGVRFSVTLVSPQEPD